MYFIRSGKVSLLLDKEVGGNTELGPLEAGEHFGEMALIDGGLRSATAIATEDDTELEVLDRESFLCQIRQRPEFALEVMQNLSQRVRSGNILYLEVIRGAMAPYCPHNCLDKTMNAFIRNLLSQGDESNQEAPTMTTWKCDACDFVYDSRVGDPAGNIPPGTPFEQLPCDWVCPICGATKGMFHKRASS
jgi:rubredoxin